MDKKMLFSVVTVIGFLVFIAGIVYYAKNSNVKKVPADSDIHSGKYVDKKSGKVYDKDPKTVWLPLIIIGILVLVGGITGLVNTPIKVLSSLPSNSLSPRKYYF